MTHSRPLTAVTADEVLPAPVKTEEAVQDFIQCAMHVEGQKFGSLEVRNPKGIQLTSMEYRALCAVQQILSQYRYQGNRPDPSHPGQNLGRNLEGKGRFRNVTAVYDHDVRTAQYFDAFGVAKVKQSVAGEDYRRYSPRHAADAMEALHSVANKRFEISYRKRLLEKLRNRKGESYGQPVEVWTQVTAIVTLFKITPYQEGEGRPNDAHEPLQRRYLRRLIITPEPFLVDQLHSYYTLKPANYHSALVSKYGKLNDFVTPFLDWLNYLAQRYVNNQKAPEDRQRPWDWTVRHTVRELAAILKMDAYVRKGNWDRIRATLKRCYEIGIQEGYLSSVEQETENHVLAINRFRLPHRPNPQGELPLET